MQSENINELVDALSKVQASIKSAIKAKPNQAFVRDGKASLYADLPAVWDACREALTANGIAIVQSPQSDIDGHAWLETTLAHKSGQWMRSSFPLKPTKPDMQGMMAALTYARRGALASMVGVMAENEDDDGNAASSVNSAPAPDKISAKQLADLRALITETGTDIEKFCLAYGIEALPDLAATSYQDATGKLSKKRKPHAVAAE